MAHFSGLSIVVPEMGGKLDALLAYGKRHPDRGYPTTRTALANVMNASGAAGSGKLNSSRLHKVVNDDSRFSDELHAALLAAYGIGWPCPPYYDPEHVLDKDPGQFRRMLAALEGATVLLRERLNEPEFPLEEMYVMELRETADGQTYCADVVAKPSTFPIVGDEGTLLGQAIGKAGFPQLSIRAETPDGAMVWSRRPDNWRPASPYQVRDRSSGPLFLWQVRTHPEDKDKPYLDDNIDVCRIYVANLSDGDRLVITTTAPLPELKLCADEKLIEPDQQVRYQRIAQNQILEKYRDRQGPIDRKDILRLGQVVLRKQQDK